MLLIAGVVLANVGTEFLPKLDEGSLWVRAFLPATIAPRGADEVVENIRDILATFPEVKTVVSQLGRPDDGTDINGWDVMESAVELKPRPEWTTAHTRDGLIASMNRKLSAIPGVEFQFSQYIEDNVNEAVSGTKAELSIKVYGADLDKLQILADQLVDVLRKIPGAADVSTEQLSASRRSRLNRSRRHRPLRSGARRRPANCRDGTQRKGGDPGAGGRALLRARSEGRSRGDIRPELRSARIPVFGAAGERLTLGDVTSIDVRAGYSRIWREGNAGALR